jgi:hypothetical protein
LIGGGLDFQEFILHANLRAFRHFSF